MAGAPTGPRYRGHRFVDVTQEDLVVGGTVVLNADDTDGVTVQVDDVAIVGGTLDVQDGGTVTQATSKSTGVTLNTHSGQITMDNASLAGAAEVAFTVTNSVVAATDCIIVNLASADTPGEHVVTVAAVASGSFDIMVGNMSGSATTDALVVNFVVIKGASS